MPVQAHTVRVDRLISPAPLDLVSIEFISEDEAANFVPPVWFGAEVTQNDSYINRVMAITGLPDTPETEASIAGLETVLDILEGVALRERDVQRPFVSPTAGNKPCLATSCLRFDGIIERDDRVRGRTPPARVTGAPC